MNKGLEEIKEHFAYCMDEGLLFAEQEEKLLEKLYEKAERVQELENRNKELEYASKFNGELNEFLQKRKLPPKTLGRHVVDVVMDYVQELETSRKEIAASFGSEREQNKRYREAIEKACDGLLQPEITRVKVFRELNEALESDSNA